MQPLKLKLKLSQNIKMPGQKTLENRLDICCENIRSRISLMEAYAGDDHAVNIHGLMSLAQNLSTVEINNHIIMCDNTIRIIGELKNLLKDENRRRSLEIQLADCEKAINKKLDTKKRINNQRRAMRFNPYQIEAALPEENPVSIRRQKSK